MSLALKGCPKQTCEGLDYIDRTGTYDAVTNPGGYGPPNGVDDPSAFDTYTLTIWRWDIAEPSSTNYTVQLNLLTDLPVVDPDTGFYHWEFTLEQLGLSAIDSGAWYFEAKGVKDGDEYIVAAYPYFTDQMWDMLKPKMLALDLGCACPKGCEDPVRLFGILGLVRGCNPRCVIACSLAEARRIFAYLRVAITNCC